MAMAAQVVAAGAQAVADAVADGGNPVVAAPGEVGQQGEERHEEPIGHSQGKNPKLRKVLGGDEESILVKHGVAPLSGIYGARIRPARRWFIPPGEKRTALIWNKGLQT